MQILYTAEATATGGREGAVTTPDGYLDVDLSVPEELGGPGSDGTTNPEQLFAAGYAACFHSALKLVVKGAKASDEGSTVSARVGLGANDAGGFGFAVELVVALPAVDQATAEQLAAKAHQVCPYSNATRGNIDVDLSVTGSR